MRLLKKNPDKKRYLDETGGFVLIFAILLATVILTIGIAVLDISVRQVMFTGSGRDSSLAFYAADAALECTLYQDMIGEDFKDDHIGTNGSTMQCENLAISNRVVNCSDPVQNKTCIWSIEVNFSGSTCAHVLITKDFDATGIVTSTTVRASGYNTTCPSSGPSAKRLERGLQASY